MITRIINARLLLRNSNGKYSAELKDLFIKDGKIIGIGQCEPCDDVVETIDAKDKLVMPGLINMHTHAYMNIFKNYADDLPFKEWLFDKIMPVEDTLDPEIAYWTTLLACIEMIQSGTTCFVDMHLFKGQSCKAAKEAGMRAFIGRGLVGDDLYGDGYSRFMESIEEGEEYRDELVEIILSPHAIYTCSEKLISQVNDEAIKRGILKQTHLSESDFEVETCYNEKDVSPVELLDRIGFLDKTATLAHCVKLSDNDIDILAKRGANVVTNPASNAKLGNGFARVADMVERGVNVCLGTDSVASNNTLNMFREMGILTLMQKGLKESATVLNSHEVIDFATVNGAKALGLEGKIGVIREGASADLIFVDLNSPSLFPNNDVVTSLCYSANGSEVESVMINGKFVMKDRKMLTIDTERVYAEVKKAVEKYL